MAHFNLKTNELLQNITTLKAGDSISLTGEIYTARDAAHKRFMLMLDKGEKLPFGDNFIIYYAGPTPNKPGQIIGSCGPTTSSRMDPYAVTFMQNGMCAMIGKGKRADYVTNALKENLCVYLIAVGGAGAYISKCVKDCKVICFDDLGCESVKKLYVENFEVYVADDIYGNSLYK